MQNIALTQRGRECYIHEGYVYTFDRINVDGDIKFWRCQSKNLNCKARLHTRKDEVVKMMNEHNHEVIPFGMKMRDVKKKKRRKPKIDEAASGEGTTDVIAGGSSIIDPFLTQVSKKQFGVG